MLKWNFHVFQLMLLEVMKLQGFTSSRTEISSVAVALNWRDNIM